ncbi:hypothetical protein [Kiloniella antarctica]|uniref:Uncharacterized protein n=1 Tax=Kiloniella antarctica TaxID=1550907 RepID=A0ABW5BMD1_9PROT
MSELKRTRISENWDPTDANIDYAKERGWTENSIANQALKFRNYWASKAGKKALNLDWDLVWKLWVEERDEQTTREQPAGEGGVGKIVTREREPIFLCQGEFCAGERAWPSETLSVLNGDLVCDDCLNNLDHMPPRADLQPFVPKYMETIQSQQEEITKLKQPEYKGCDYGSRRNSTGLIQVTSAPLPFVTGWLPEKHADDVLKIVSILQSQQAEIEACIKAYERCSSERDQLQSRNKELEGALDDAVNDLCATLEVDEINKIRRDMRKALSSTKELTPKASEANEDSGETGAEGLIKYLEDECLNLECENEPTGGDDYDVAWKVYSHHQGEPYKRLEGFGRTPIEAIRDALPLKPEGE